jgi:hypothetical protein
VSRLAKSFETQCSIGKYFGPFGKRAGTYRCQLTKNHEGKHIDAFGRKWPRDKREAGKP